MMIKRVENPPLLDENAQRFVLTKDLQFMPVQQQGAGNKTDPIFELFNPPADVKEGKKVHTVSIRNTRIKHLLTHLQISLTLDYVMPWLTWWLPFLRVLLSPTTCGTTCLQQMN